MCLRPVVLFMCRETAMFTTRIYSRASLRATAQMKPEPSYVEYKLGVLETQWHNEPVTCHTEAAPVIIDWEPARDKTAITI